MSSELDIPQRAQIACWYENLKSAASVRRKFLKAYPERRNDLPGNWLIINTHQRLFETGSVLPQPKRKKTGIARTVVNAVVGAFTRSPSKSIRRAEAELNVSRSSIQRVLIQEKFFPYKIQLLQKLNEDDPDRRLEFCEWFLSRYEVDERVLSLIIFSDEAIFQLDGKVNRQNCRIWGQENPHAVQEVPLHSEKVMVWAALWSRGIIGPYFFDGNVDRHSYHNLLVNFLWPQLENLDNIDELWFQQDGAPPHYATLVRDWLDENFEDRWIGRRGAIEWPPRSPDLTPLDFYLWGALKGTVYRLPKPTTTDELKARIIEDMGKIDRETIQGVLLNFVTRCRNCVSQDGGHFQNLL
jgi:hypothetical protein